jgi:hypothetical protein
MDGEVTGQEKLELDRRLASDAALREEYENLKLAKEGVRLFGIREKVNAIHHEMMTTLSVIPPKTGKVKQFIRYSAAVAAAVVLVVVSVLTYNFINLSSEKLYSRYQVKYELITFRGDSAKSTVVEKAYREKNYKGVTVFAEKGKLTNSREELLAGLSYLESGNPSKAINYFKKIVASGISKENELFQAAEYYLAMSYLRNQDYDQSIEIMEKIHSDPTHLYQPAISRKLINRVKILKWK